MSPVVVQADLSNETHRSGIVELLDMYASEPLQGGKALSDEVRSRLISGLAAQTNGRYFLALEGETPVGIAICFVGFSTFWALPLLNVHDLAVHRDFRGKGLGTLLLTAAEQEAVRLGCCKLTLEIQQENFKARRLYERFGFGSGDPNGAESAFMTKTLVEPIA
ncbi:MAG: GNAT family N-acetyltransferase [Planctomycetaceae bacterium]|nr:GNAT family N-acetyltransferase [Planctomycetales bacterium]MCB9926811.1 GNAT family N-acetyltransferase [Planctomycetaceae bacterium]